MSSTGNARSRLESLKSRRAARLSCPRDADRTGASMGDTSADSIRMPSITATSQVPGAKPSKGARMVRNPTPLIPVVVDGPQSDKWAILAKKAEEQLLRERHANRIEHQRKVAEQKRVLDEQVELRKRRKAEERAKFLAERSIVDSQYDDWVADKGAVVKDNRKIMQAIGEDRQTQIDVRAVKKKEEVARNIEADQAILANIQRQDAEAKERKLEQRRRQEAMRDELIRANEDLKARKEREKAADAQWLHTVEDEMRRREELEHRKRDEEAMAFKDKVKGREAMALKLQATVEQRAAEDERKAHIVTRQREAKEDEERRLQAELRERLKNAVLATREVQLEERSRIRALAEKRKLKEREELDALVEQEKKVKATRLQELQEKRQVRKEEVQRELQEKTRYQRVLMSEDELRLNKHLLE